jgi:NAD(P)-dependent dehydrogenase (short-subunit alcohol dehydrogenase family)
MTTEKHLTAGTTTVERFAGEVAFVTAAASGIGRATPLAFADAGARVVVADVADDENEQTARPIDRRRAGAAEWRGCKHRLRRPVNDGTSWLRS